MNDEAQPTASSPTPAPQSGEWAKSWRSDCIDQFSAIEHRLQTLLNCMAAANRRGAKVKTGLPIRQAFDEVRRLTAAKGSFAKEGRAIQRTLACLEAHLDWRAHLTHGQLQEWRCKKGDRSLLTLKLFDPDASGCTRYHAYPRAESEERLETLEKIAKDLHSQCGLVRNQLTPKKQSPGPAGTPS